MRRFDFARMRVRRLLHQTRRNRRRLRGDEYGQWSNGIGHHGGKARDETILFAEVGVGSAGENVGCAVRAGGAEIGANGNHASVREELPHIVRFRFALQELRTRASETSECVFLRFGR